MGAIGNIDTQPYKTETRQEVQATTGYLRRQIWTTPLAASGHTTYIVNAMSTASGGNATIAHQPDFARLLAVVLSGTGTGNVVITGTNIHDSVITETVALNGATPVNTLNAFKTVTSIAMPTISARTMNVGILDTFGLARRMSEDSYVLGTANGTLEATRATIAYDKDTISKNLVTFNTPPDGSKNFAAWYMTSLFSNLSD